MLGSPRIAASACLLIVTVAFLPLATSQAPRAQAEAPDCPPHPPIEIREDVGPRGFVLGHRPNGEPIHRPGSGVVAGNGTEEHPYVIEGWCITGERAPFGLTIGGTGTDAGILVNGTSAHVVVQDNEVTGFQTGIHVAEAAPDTVTLESNTIGEPAATVDTQPARELAADAAEAAGVHRLALFALGGTPEPSEAIGGGGSIHLDHAPGTAVVGNDVASSIDVEASPDTLVEANALHDSLAFDASHGSTVRDNAVNGTWDVGLYVVDSNEVTLEGNDVDQQGYMALSLNRVEDVTVRGNELSAHPEAPWWPGAITLLVTGTEEVRFEDNRFGNGAAGTQTSANLTFSDNEFHGAGLYVPDPVESNHTIEATNEVNGQPLRFVAETDDVTVREPAGQVIVDEAANVTLERLDIVDAGVSAEDAPDLTVVNSTLTGGGVFLEEASGSVVRDTTVVGGEIAVRDSTDVLVEDNVATGDDWAGISLDGVHEATVRHNHATDNGVAGIEVHWSGDVTIEANVVHGNGAREDWGVGGLDVSSNVDVDDNNIWGNEGLGLEAPSQGHVDASGNWWGCPEGPSDEDCDDVAGTATVEPVLESPNPEAGPR